MGRTPLFVNLPLSYQDLKRKAVATPPFTVQWASGTKLNIPQDSVDISKGRFLNYTVQRPQAPGRELDVLFAVENERNQTLHETARLQRESNAIQAGANILQSQQINAYNDRTSALRQPVNVNVNGTIYHRAY
jgi:hypothetical protein